MITLAPRQAAESSRLRAAEIRRAAHPASSADLDSELQRLDTRLGDLIDSRDSYYRTSRKVSDGLLKGGIGLMIGGVALGRLAGGLASSIAVGVGLASAILSAPVNMVLSAVLMRKDAQLGPLAARRLEVARQRLDVAGAEDELREAKERYDRVVGETQRLQEALASRGGRVEDLGSAVRIGGIVLAKSGG